MSIPKVTIVTPSFNQGVFLERTIQSVLGQDYPNIEYIIMDGGSTDESVDIIRRYEHRLAHWESKPDGGQSHAINAGFARAKGEVFNWLNSDDVLMPSAVSIAMSYLERYPKTAMVYGDRIRIDPAGNMLWVDELHRFRRSEMLYNLAIPQETAFVRRRVWEEVAGVDEELRYCMDYDLWVRLSRGHDIRHMPFVLGAFRMHARSKSCSDIEGLRGELETVMMRHFGRTRSKTGKRIHKMKSRLRSMLLGWDKVRKKEIAAIRRMLLKPAACIAASDYVTDSCSAK